MSLGVGGARFGCFQAKAQKNPIYDVENLSVNQFDGLLMQTEFDQVEESEDICITHLEEEVLHWTFCGGLSGGRLTYHRSLACQG